MVSLFSVSVKDKNARKVFVPQFWWFGTVPTGRGIIIWVTVKPSELRSNSFGLENDFR